MDSRTSENIFQIFQWSDISLRQTNKSKNGYRHEAVGGHSIINWGGRDIVIMIQEGDLYRMTFYVIEIINSLRFVADLVDAGYNIEFEHKTRILTRSMARKYD